MTKRWDRVTVARMTNPTWKHHGPEPKTSIAVPPLPSLIDWYAMGFDEARQRVFYLCRPDDDERGGELHEFDGSAWHCLSNKRVELPENVEGGGWDSRRKSVVSWSFGHDHEAKRPRAVGTLINEQGGKALNTKGDDPIATGEDEDVGTFDKSGLFVFDRAREVWVCLTRCGVWELDANDSWSKKSDGALVPKDWHNKSGEGTFDPIGKRAVFMMQEREDYTMVVLAWDGHELRKLSMDGLPKLTMGFSDPIVQISGHNKHGLVLHAGEGKLFAVRGGGWSALPATSDPPPMMEDAIMTHDPKRDLLILGPGKHKGAGGSDRHDTFFVLKNGQWERQGVAIAHSLIKSASYGNCRMAHHAGTWFALGTHSLQTWKWTDDAWRLIEDDTVGNGKLGGWEILQLVSTERLHAVMASGAVYALEGDRWKTICKKDPVFKDRTEFCLAADPNGRIVVWGGEAKGRKLNDTLFLENGKWRAAKKSSPQPLDFKHGRKDRVYVGASMIYDGALGTFVRFGFEEVAVLQTDETWKLYKPKGYQDAVTCSLWGHVPMFDAETGETLILDFEGDPKAAYEAMMKGKWADQPARISRFDLAECKELATVEVPAERARKKQHDRAPFHDFAESFSYDPKTRSLYTQVLEDSSGVYRLDLSELFTEAKSIGARTVLNMGAATSRAAVAFEATRLYKIAKGKAEVVSLEPGAKSVTTTSGAVGEKGARKDLSVEAATALVATKRKAGFVNADKLDRDALISLVGVSSHELKVGKAIKGKQPNSRVGGTPSGVTEKTWPKIRKTPMGFLFQLETGDLLEKHAGIAVFCALDGEAANEPEENSVVLLKASDFKKTCAAPNKTPTLAMREITIEDAKIEIDEDRAEKIGSADSDLAAAFERLQSMKGMQKDNLATRLGGSPQFLQDIVTMKMHRFIAQLDFDSINTSKEWPDAGLMGCVYVFVNDPETEAVAFWQYT